MLVMLCDVLSEFHYVLLLCAGFCFGCVNACAVYLCYVHVFLFASCYVVLELLEMCFCVRGQ